MKKIKSKAIKFNELLLVSVMCMLFVSADTIHSKVFAGFSNPKEWISQVIDPQQYTGLYGAGVWSDPVTGPTLRTSEGEGYFHFPRLESWLRESNPRLVMASDGRS